MPLSAISLARLSECHPLLAQRAKQVSIQFEVDFPNYTIQVSQGLRSWNYQAALYAQGRQPLNVVNELRSALRLAPITAEDNHEVTDAQPGQSNHNYGYACDWDIVDLSNNTLDWNDKDAQWLRLESLAAPNGLRSGSCFKKQDNPHMELQEVPEAPPTESQYILRNQGLAAVWQEAGLS